MSKFHTRTKIICTIGPAVNSKEMLIELVRSGMDVARLNFSHGDHEAHGHVIQLLKEVREELKIPLAIMLDTKGPEIRVGKLAEDFVVQKGLHAILVKEGSVSNKNVEIPIRPAQVLEKLSPGDTVLFDNGYITAHVLEVKEGRVSIEFSSSGIIKAHKGINIPYVKVGLPAVTEKDVEDIIFGCREGVDYIAASFIRSPDHVLQIKKILEENGGRDILVIAKIENAEGVENFDAILQASDGIMVARGDLGVEISLTEVPRLQKLMIRKSYLAGKPAVTATQMLESMISNNRPTRAETSDVANAIYDSTSSVMLSGETAVGEHPLETVACMRSIITATEEDFDYRLLFDLHAKLQYHDVPSAVTLAAVKTSYSSNAKAIFAFTTTGHTARLLSRLRPNAAIIAVTPSLKTYHQLNFNWGVFPVYHSSRTLSEAFSVASSFALEKGIASFGDLVIVTAGTPFGFSGTTNMMIVESIGDVLVRGGHGKGSVISGNISLLPTASVKPAYTSKGQLIVLQRCSEEFLPHIRECRGVIMQNLVEDIDSEIFLEKIALEYAIPYILRADNAMTILKEKQLVTLDPSKGIVYKGIVIEERIDGLPKNL